MRMEEDNCEEALGRLTIKRVDSSLMSSSSIENDQIGSSGISIVPSKTVSLGGGPSFVGVAR